MVYGLHAGGAICSAEGELRTIATLAFAWDNERSARAANRSVLRGWGYRGVSTSRVLMLAFFNRETSTCEDKVFVGSLAPFAEVLFAKPDARRAHCDCSR